jgi:CRISPR-associated endonuclease/helicase Cas3
MIDVGVVARRMWRGMVADAAQAEIASSLGLTPDEAENWVTFIAALHDLGKASPAFQLRHESAHLHHLYRELGSPPNVEARDCPHGRVTAGELPALLESIFGIDPEVALRLATLTGGHHGVFSTSLGLNITIPPVEQEEALEGAAPRADSDLEEPFHRRSGSHSAGQFPFDDHRCLLV